MLATAPGVAATVGADEPLPACDFEIPMLSLAHRLRVGPDDVAVHGAYLRCDASLRASITPTLAGSDRRRIGLAWAGAAHHRNDRRRSMPLTALAPVLSLPGIAWYSLQKGRAAAQVAQFAAGDRIAPLDRQRDFADTAALVDALDAVVSVDTSIAHLAGALGKPVFVLLPFAADWRWGISGNRTAWYEGARLFRQPAIGDWASPVAALRDALNAS